MLCDKTEQDLRSCLNTLQFLAKRKKLICSTDLTGLQCGQKDISKSAFQMWQQLFLDKVHATAQKCVYKQHSSEVTSLTSRYPLPEACNWPYCQSCNHPAR